eukprot:4947976-Prymnesium_polylepis.2
MKRPLDQNGTSSGGVGVAVLVVGVLGLGGGWEPLGVVGGVGVAAPGRCVVSQWPCPGEDGAHVRMRECGPRLPRPPEPCPVPAVVAGCPNPPGEHAP